MALNIKNPETHRLAQELAKKMGQSLSEAVTDAIREKLVKVDASKDRRTQLVIFIEESEDSLTPRQRKDDLFAELYNEEGLPQ